MQGKNQNTITLKTKLTPPCLDGILDRPRLTEHFKALKTFKLMTVTAGAGYGKSTAAAQACLELNLDTVWYRLDDTDNDIITLIHYLITGIRSYYPDFGIDTLKRMRSAENLVAEQRSILTVMLHEMEQICQSHLVIVLDDFHLIPEESDIQSALDFLLKHIPCTIHFVLISRTSIDDRVAGFIADRDALFITENELSFTSEEIAALYQNIFNIPLLNRDHYILQQKTGGWAVGLVLFHYLLTPRETDGLESRQDLLSGNNQLVEAYIKESLFKRLSDDLRTFLMKTSFLPYLEVEFCNQLLAIDNAGELLRRLEKMHLFTFAFNHSRKAYYYHHLFKEFLIARFTEEVGEEAVGRLYCDAARLWDARGNHRQAIEYYIKGGGYPAACRLLQQYGRGLVENGHVNRILACFKQIPTSFWNGAPWLEYLLGYASFLKGRTQEALEKFEAGRRAFKQQGNVAGEELCQISSATGYCIYGDYLKAGNIFKELLARGPENSIHRIISFCSLVYISARMGEKEEADIYFNAAHKLVDTLQDPSWRSKLYSCYTFRFFQSEDYSRHLYYAEKSERIAVRLKHYNQVVLSRFLIAAAHFQMGEYRKSLDSALGGIRLAEECGLLDTSYAWCLIHAAMALAHLGDLSKAQAYCRQSLQICKTTESDWTEAWTYMTLGQILIRMGDPDGAAVSGRRSLDAIERTPLQYDKNIIKIVFALTLLSQNRLDEAMDLIQSVGPLSTDSKMFNWWGTLFYAGWNWQSGNRDAAKTNICNALASSDQPGSNLWWQDHHLWLLPLLAATYVDGNYRAKMLKLLAPRRREHLDLLERLIRSQPPQTAKAAQVVFKAIRQEEGPSLRICCFGKFALSVGDIHISSKQWVSVKARMLLKYLAFHSHRSYISKERLLELLWPEQDPEATTKRLHVALTAIRKILEPGLKRGKPSTYLLRDGEGYRLNLGRDGFLDVAAFDQALVQAEKATNTSQVLGHYLRAESLYKGDIFEEEPYMQWCVDAREIYIEKYTALLKKIALLYQGPEALDRRIEYLRRALEMDEYAEDIYCLLMDAYHQAGNRFMAIKTYEKCTRKLENDLKCPLSKDTKALFNNLISA